MDEKHREEVNQEYNRYASITGMDSSTHFYPKEHYGFFLQTLKRFHASLATWKAHNYHGVVFIVPPLYDEPQQQNEEI